MIRNVVKNIPHSNNIDKTLKASIHNRFDIEVRDAKTGKIKQKAQAFNVICSNLWTQFNKDTWFSYIAYGNGVGTPSTEDTNLFGTSGYVSLSNVETITDIEKGVCWRTRKATLNETAAVDVIISEVGLSYSNSNGCLCTHAMLQDMNGNQISIHKTSTDIITFYATVFVHWVPSGYDNVTISKHIKSTKKSYDITGTFLATALGYGFGLGVRTDYAGISYYELVRAGLGTFATTDMIQNAYDYPPIASWNPITKSFTVELPRIAVGKGNIDGGFGWIRISNRTDSMSPYKFAVIDVRGAYEVVGESLGTGDGSKTEFKTIFDLPTNATIFVDGAVASNVRVLTIPRLSNASEYFVQIEDVLYNGKLIYRCDDDGALGCYYNPLYEIGIQSFSADSTYRFSFSNDMITWSDLISPGTIPEEYRHCKYIKITSTSANTTSIYNLTVSFPPNMYGNNIIFNEPPAQGSVITINYTTPFVPKDSNHVYDISLAVQYGEYSQEGV